MGTLSVPCALGRSGLSVRKREGDGATPIGTFALRGGYYRADRMLPLQGFKLKRLGPSDGWCDAPAHFFYNRHVRHPFAASAEHLWRDDHLYDVVIVIGHNDRPRRRGMGSAIFLHLARDGLQPTEGCIALKRTGMLKVVSRLRRHGVIRSCG